MQIGYFAHIYYEDGNLYIPANSPFLCGTHEINSKLLSVINEYHYFHDLLMMIRNLAFCTYRHVCKMRSTYELPVCIKGNSNPLNLAIEAKDATLAKSALDAKISCTNICERTLSPSESC